MENASKALLMAAGVLIGVMILSLGAYLFSVFGDTTGSIEKQIAEKQINEFNSQFTKYEGLENCTIYDIVSVINLAKSNNRNYEYTNQDLLGYNQDWKTSNKITNGSAPNYIYVGILGIDNNGLKQNLSTDDLTDLIKKYSTKEVTNEEGKKEIENVYFKCTSVTVNNITKKVQGIIFKAQS